MKEQERSHGGFEKLYTSGQPSCSGSGSPEEKAQGPLRYGGQNVKKEAQRCLLGKALKN